MHDLHIAAQHIRDELNAALKQLRFDEMQQTERQLSDAINAPDFWTDSARAQDISRQHAKLNGRLKPWRTLQQSVAESIELLELNDETLRDDLAHQLQTIQTKFDDLKNELKFSGPYDDYDIILSVYAGAGGTDAQDWARMLLRMYVRWAEKKRYNVTTIDESSGDEAGIKSATIEIKGDLLYGKLQGEHGVHRLVRLSPFNADSLRQTSFARVDVLPLVSRSDDVVISEKDLRIDVYRSGGHGGQSVNTTDSAVRITHIPTNIVVAIQNERSQLQNKELAMTILRSKLLQLQIEQHQAKITELKGPNQSAEWGNQIRSYVLHPYKQVKDLRTKYETSDPENVLDGEIDELIEAYLSNNLGKSTT